MVEFSFYVIKRISSRIQKKKVNEFEELLRLAYSYIRDKKFEGAVQLYTELEKKFKSLPKYKKTKKLHQDILILYKEISLYLRVNEAYLMAQQGKLSKLKQELDDITDLSKEIQELPDAAALIEYTNKHYQFCLEVYTYKITLNNFNHLYNETKNSIDNSDILTATKFYSQLLIVYNSLLRYEDYEKRIELYYKTKDLCRDLEVHTLIKKAYKNKYPWIEEPKLLEKDKNVKDFRPRNLPEKYTDSAESYTKIRETLAKGDYTKVSEVYKKV